MKYFFAALFALQYVFTTESSKKLARDKPREFFKRFGVNFIDHQNYFLVDTFNIAHSRFNQAAAREFVDTGKQVIFIKGGMLPLVDEAKFDVYYLPEVAHLIVAIQVGFSDQYLILKAWKRKKNGRS